MLERIIRFSLTQRLFVLISFILLIIVGAYSWKTIAIDAFPDISSTQVNIIIKAPGMTAEEIEQQVTRVVETELLGIPNKSILRSTTKYAITSITLDFHDGTDIYWARQQVNERLQNIWNDLPEGVSGGLAPMSTPLSEMFMFSIENPNLSLTERKHILDWQIRPLLRTVPGVAEVNVLGGYTSTIQYAPDIIKLQEANISLEEIQTVIEQSNLNGSIGKINIGTDSITIRSEGKFKNLESISDLIVKNDNGEIYYLKSLGEVFYGNMIRYGAVTKDGYETTEALIVALKDSNTAQVVQGVKTKLEQIKTTLPEGTELNVFYDRTNLIDTAVHTITSALIQAILLVIVLLAFFLWHVKASFVVSLSIPIAVVITFFLMKQFGLSANLMSLGGLVIAIGMIVDSSVVVIENIVSQLNKGVNLPRMHLIYRACKSVAKPVFSGTIIVIMVFIPLLSLSGLEGKLFSPVALTIVFAMTIALLASVTIIPVIATFLITSQENKTPTFILRMQNLFSTSLSKVLKAPFKFMVFIFSVLLISVFLFFQIGKIFMPVLDEGDLIVQLEKTPVISLKESIDLDKQIEKALLKEIPEIKQIVARTGSDELGLDPMSLNETDIFMELQPIDTWRFATKTELENAIRKLLLKFPGINFGFTQPIQMRVSEMLTGSTGAVTVKVFGENVSKLSELAHEISRVIKTVEGSVDIQTTLIEGGDYINIILKPEIASEYQLTVSELSRYLKSQIDGVQISELISGKFKTPILFSNNLYDDSELSSINQLKNYNIIMPDNSILTLKDIADISFSEGPAIIERENAERFAVVACNVENRDIVGFVEEITEKIGKDVNLPSGYLVEFGGEFESQIRASNNLMMVIPVVLLLIVIILFTTFKSLLKSFLILANIPFAMMGGVISLYISGEYLSVPASVGFIALLGVAILNGVVMLSHFEEMRYQTTNLIEKISNAATDRLRPILMTATTAMFGLIPLVIATGPGAEIQKPLAIVVIGGLFSSTLATLYLLPFLYYKIESKQNV
ncbi:MAG: CusA/CzcA family heavy metal efflux RND transporter [Gammaproteobacteria bacterium]|jgi:cobalt-zinc-cadmium resistance protein CzcA